DSFRHDHDAAFRRLVGGKIRHALDSRAAGGVDDHAAALLDHLRDRILAAEEYALQTHVHDPVPFFLARVHHVFGHEDAGVIEQDVEPAERAYRFIDHPHGCGADAHVNRHRPRDAAGLLDLSRGIARRFGAYVGDHQLRALLRKPNRAGAADSRTRA